MNEKSKKITIIDQFLTAYFDQNLKFIGTGDALPETYAIDRWALLDVCRVLQNLKKSLQRNEPLQ